MNDAQLLRYSRHLLLEEIDVEGQERLLASHAVIIGAGGLGSPAAMYLTSTVSATPVPAAHVSPLHRLRKSVYDRPLSPVLSASR